MSVQSTVAAALDQQAEVPARVPVNGHKKERMAIVAVGIGLLACILAQVALGAALLVWPPQDWNLLNKMVDNLGTIATLLGGGLLALIRQQSS